MKSLKELKEWGQTLGYEGASLQGFVRDQQEIGHAKRQYNREAKRGEIENTKEQKEHGRELKKLADIEEEKKRTQKIMMKRLRK